MGNVLRTLGLGAVVVALGGCWPAPGAGPDRRSHNPFEDRITVDTVADLEPAWTAATDGGPVGDPVLSNVAVHVTDGQAVYGFDGRTGARRWKTPPAPEVFEGWYQPVVLGDRVLVAQGDTGNRINATRWLDAATGADTGTLASAGHVDGLRRPWVLLRSVTYGSLTPVGIGFGLAAVDGSATGNGGLIEVHDLGSTDGQPLTLGRQRVYHAGPGMAPPGPTPPEDWTIGVRAFGLDPTPATCGPPAAPFFACPLWATELDGNPTTPPVLAADESTVYAGTASGTLYALDAADGHVLWQTDLGGAPTAAPALADGTLFVPVAGGELVAVDAGGCEAASCPASWTAPLGGAGEQPAVAGGVVFVGSSTGDAGDATGTVEAFDAGGCGQDTCAPVWAHDLDEPVTGAPAVSSGHLYVGTGSTGNASGPTGHLVAFAPPSP